MKIGIDCREITKEKITGIGRFLLEFLNEVKKYTAVEFILFGNQYTDFSKSELNGYKTIVLREINTLWWDHIQLNKGIKENKIDIFFSLYYKFPIFAKVPVVSTIFDLIYLVVEPYKSMVRNIFYANFIKLTINHIKKTITCSNSAKQDLIKILNLPEKKIDVVYLSVSKNFIPQSKQRTEEIKKKYNIDKKYILYVGNSNPHKNLSRLVEAYSFLPNNIRKEYYLLLAGVNTYNLRFTTHNLRLLNFIPDNDLPALYSGAELFVFPSLYEGFGLPPLEAMACGCPVVSSNTSSMPEILGDACIYFNPYDVKELSSAIQNVLGTKSLQNELRQKGLKRATLFSPEKMVNSLLNVFSSII